MTGIFGNRWWVVFASICGLLVGAGAVHIFAFGVFPKPVSEDLGIGRGELSSGLILTSTLNALGCLPLGYLLDRFGVRRVMMPGIILYAIGIMGWSLLGPTATLIFLTFSFAGLFGAIGSPVPYGAVLTLWFDRHRGLAIGIAMAGVGLGVAVIPQLAAFFIRSFGWRIAYVARRCIPGGSGRSPWRSSSRSWRSTAPSPTQWRCSPIAVSPCKPRPPRCRL